MSVEPTVFVVDDDVSILKGLTRTIAAAGWQVQTYTSGEAFLGAYNESIRGCVVLDLRMPRISGLTVQEKLVQQGVHLPAIFITGYGDVPTAVQAMQAGAIDFIEKPFREQTLLRAIEKAVSHDVEQRKSQSQRDIALECLARLTSREREILDLLITGCPNKDIAARLRISQRTVETHRSRIMAKMQATSPLDLAYMVVLEQYAS